MKKENKKPTAAQMERRLSRAVVHLDRTSDTKEIYFDDKGMRITIDDLEGYAVVSTVSHRHVFNSVTANGYSRPFLYLRQFVDIALANDCLVRDAKGNPTRSYAKLFQSLDEKEDKTEANIAHKVDEWLFVIFQPLYSIYSGGVGDYLLFIRYAYDVARNHILLEENKENMTVGEYIKAVHEKVLSFIEDMKDTVLFAAKTDEEIVKEEVEAMQEESLENNMQEEVNNEGGE